MKTSKLALMVCLISMLAGTCLAQGSCGDSLAVVNAFRSQHQAPALSWSNDLMAAAQDSATKLAANGCSLSVLGRHQLVYGCTGGTCTCSMAAGSFYQGVSKYDFAAAKPWTANQRNFMAVGTFMQLVWKSATQMGCAAASGRGGCTVVACNFDEGVISMDDWVAANVFPKLASPSTPSTPTTPSTPNPPANPPPSTPQPATGCRASALAQINVHRAAHSAAAVRWDSTLARAAEATAKRSAASGCSLRGGVAGQLLYAATGAPRGVTQCGKAADNWYQGADKYTYAAAPWAANRAKFNQVGGFMNMVWAGAKKVGCAEARGANGCVTIVCQFDAAVMSTDTAVRANVLRPAQPAVGTPEGSGPAVVDSFNGGDFDAAMCSAAAQAGDCASGRMWGSHPISFWCPNACHQVLRNVQAGPQPGAASVRRMALGRAQSASVLTLHTEDAADTEDTAAARRMALGGAAPAQSSSSLLTLGNTGAADAETV